MTVRKYRNTPTVLDGIRFDSKAEATRWAQLLLMQRGGLITDLRRQVTFPITWNGLKICSYIADFVYTDAETVDERIEDVKGVPTPEYRIKAKMMAAMGNPVIEVRA
jgi:hypothetical protein